MQSRNLVDAIGGDANGCDLALGLAGHFGSFWVILLKVPQPPWRISLQILSICPIDKNLRLGFVGKPIWHASVCRCLHYLQDAAPPQQSLPARPPGETRMAMLQHSLSKTVQTLIFNSSKGLGLSTRVSWTIQEWAFWVAAPVICCIFTEFVTLESQRQRQKAACAQRVQTSCSPEDRPDTSCLGRKPKQLK